MLEVSPGTRTGHIFEPSNVSEVGKGAKLDLQFANTRDSLGSETFQACGDHGTLGIGEGKDVPTEFDDFESCVLVDTVLVIVYRVLWCRDIAGYLGDISRTRNSHELAFEVSSRGFLDHVLNLSHHRVVSLEQRRKMIERKEDLQSR